MMCSYFTFDQLFYTETVSSAQIIRPKLTAKIHAIVIHPNKICKWYCRINEPCPCIHKVYNIPHPTLLPWVIKTEFLLIISIQYQPDKGWE